jgi:tetratricopeptide (TPR) repeat protein
MKQRRSLPLLLLIASLCSGFVVSVNAQVVVYMKKGGETKKATDIKFSATTQEYMLTMDSVEISVPVADVDHVDLPKPKALDEAAKQIEAGKAADAIPALQKIAADYTMLTWDTTARELMIVAYAKAGDSAKAMATYKELARKAPGGRVSAQARMTYWNLMLAAGQLNDVASELDDVIAKGSREEAASAQLTRANLRKSQNKTQDALLDYLRTALLFEDVPAVQPEALFKAAEMMDALRDPRAPDLRHRLVEKYPDSEYAKKAGQL